MIILRENELERVFQSERMTVASIDLSSASEAFNDLGRGSL